MCIVFDREAGKKVEDSVNGSSTSCNELMHNYSK